MGKICEVLHDRTGKPVAIAFSEGVSKWRRHRALKKAWKQFNRASGLDLMPSGDLETALEV